MLPLRQLRKLNLQKCNLAQVPEALVSMESVTSLNLSGNHVERGWEHLRPLRRLQKLILTRAALDKRNVPEALKTLKHVRIVCW